MTYWYITIFNVRIDNVKSVTNFDGMTRKKGRKIVTLDTENLGLQQLNRKMIDVPSCGPEFSARLVLLEEKKSHLLKTKN